MMARNSRGLFWVSFRCDRLICQASPVDQENPPRPVGQASVRMRLVGRRSEMRLKLIPLVDF